MSRSKKKAKVLSPIGSSSKKGLTLHLVNLVNSKQLLTSQTVNRHVYLAQLHQVSSTIGS